MERNKKQGGLGKMQWVVSVGLTENVTLGQTLRYV